MLVEFQIATLSLYHLIDSPLLSVILASKIIGSPENDLSPPKSGSEHTITSGETTISSSSEQSVPVTTAL